MCMMASMPTPPPPKPRVPRIDEFDASKVANDTIDGMEVTNQNDRSKMKANRAENKGPTASSQSQTNLDKAY